MSIRKIGLLAILTLLAGMFLFWAWQMRHAFAAPDGQLEAHEAHAQAKAGDIVLVDIRRPGEWKASGVPASSYAITMHQNGTNFVRQLLAATGGDPNKPVALICATGSRSSWLQPRLQKAGFTNVMNVGEGLMGSRFGSGWLKKGLPIRKWTGPEPAVPQ